MAKPKTKIICTLGPASDQEAVLLKMIEAGMDVVRLNFSHGKLDSHLKKINQIKNINKKYQKNIKILGDLEGYRIRVGRLKRHAPIKVRKNQNLWLKPGDFIGDTNLIPFDYTGPLSSFNKGQHIFIDDGNIALLVEGIDKKGIKTKVVFPGMVGEHKGINIPDLIIDFVGLTGRDKVHLDFCIENKIDYLAQSFVRTKEDILVLKEYIKGKPQDFKIVAKIENRDGIKNIDEIIAVCEGIMVARGDMGVSIPIYEVPIVQKQIIKKCNLAGKTAITATQMLESMTENHLPTRAEVSDVANAILDGSNYLMLSGESAVGKYPVACVDMMDRIIRFTEQNTGASS